MLLPIYVVLVMFADVYCLHFLGGLEHNILQLVLGIRILRSEDNPLRFYFFSFF